jgi:hypothetical protein
MCLSTSAVTGLIPAEWVISASLVPAIIVGIILGARIPPDCRLVGIAFTFAAAYLTIGFSIRVRCEPCLVGHDCPPCLLWVNVLAWALGLLASSTAMVGGVRLLSRWRTHAMNQRDLPDA